MRPIRLLPLLLVLFLLPAGPVRAKDPAGPGADHPLLRRIAASSVFRGREHRALLVYPIAADFADPSEVKRARSAREAKSGEDLSVGEPEKKPGRDVVEVFNWSTDPILLLAGEVLSGGYRDRSLDRDILLAPGTRVDAPVSPADRRVRSDEDRSRVLTPFGAIAPDVMRLVALADGPEGESQKFLDGQFAIAGEKGDRRSIPELFEAKAIQGRLAEYETIFEAIPDESGKRTVGAAAWIGERLVGVDLFETNSAFRAHWPTLLRTHALQASLYEAAYGLLNQPIGGAPGMAVRDPDRHGPRVKEILKKLFAARIRKEKPVGVGEELFLTRDEILARAVTIEGRLVHAVVLLDYLDGAAGLPPPPGSNPSEVTAGELERRAERGRLTEYEKRLLERMRERNREREFPKPGRTPGRGPGREIPAPGEE